MTLNRRVLARWWLVVGFAFITSANARSQPAYTPPSSWGPVTDGVRIAISSASSDVAPTGVQFWVALQNTGTTDVILNLGYMLANGKIMFPAAVRLMFVDPSGATRELQFSDRLYPGVAGRVDDCTVALRAGALYAFPVSLDHYVTAAARRPELTPGRHRISARFEGLGASTDNLDMKGMALLNFWKGRAESNVLEFNVVGAVK